MSFETLKNNFWDLGNSKSKKEKEAIGEKGHGTKIYLRSDKVIVHTNNGEHSYEAECDGAFAKLNNGEVHTAQIRESKKEYEKGTFIRIEGFNNNDRSSFKQDIIRDYLYIYTKNIYIIFIFCLFSYSK